MVLVDLLVGHGRRRRAVEDRCGRAEGKSRSGREKNPEQRPMYRIQPSIKLSRGFSVSLLHPVGHAKIQSINDMGTAILYGAISGLSLLFGAGAGLWFRLRQKAVAAIMAFGAGVLVCALSIGLMEEAFGHGGIDAVVIGFLAGGLAFIGGDYALHRYGGRAHKRRPVFAQRRDSSGSAITLGAVLDGVPESIALGAAIAHSAGTGLLLLVAIVLSNIPEGVASVGGLRREGFSPRRIFGLWSLVGLVTLVVTAGSFILLRNLAPNTIGIFEAFAAGAILAMLADTMMPEAFEEGGLSVGILTVLGFLVAFLVSRL